RRTGRNERYLPGIALPSGLRFQTDPAHAVDSAECVVVAVPSKAFREVTRHLERFSGIIVSVTKGIEYETGLTMCGILAENAPRARCAALSGPTFAIEVAHGVPTASVGASRNLVTASQVQKLFTGPAFRVYTSNDLIVVALWVELYKLI